MYGHVFLLAEKHFIKIYLIPTKLVEKIFFLMHGEKKHGIIISREFVWFYSMQQSGIIP